MMLLVSKALQWFRFLYRLRNKIIIEIPTRVRQHRVAEI